MGFTKYNLYLRIVYLYRSFRASELRRNARIVDLLYTMSTCKRCKARTGVPQLALRVPDVLDTIAVVVNSKLLNRALAASKCFLVRFFFSSINCYCHEDGNMYNSYAQRVRCLSSLITPAPRSPRLSSAECWSRRKVGGDQQKARRTRKSDLVWRRTTHFSSGREGRSGALSTLDHACRRAAHHHCTHSRRVVRLLDGSLLNEQQLQLRPPTKQKSARESGKRSPMGKFSQVDGKPLFSGRCVLFRCRPRRQRFADIHVKTTGETTTIAHSPELGAMEASAAVLEE